MDLVNWTIKLPNIETFLPPRLPSQAESMLKSLTNQILEFERTIDDSQEVGLRLVGAPDQSRIHIERVECEGGGLLVFVGRNENGREIRLLQHVSQVSVLLTALPKIAEKAHRIGF
jgi:hypothetical protein